VRTRTDARFLVRLAHATLVALALLVVGGRANAAVPMCSEDGRTVAAPPIMRPGKVRVLESQGDCERLRLLLTRSNQGNHQGGALELGDTPPRAVPQMTVMPSAPRLARVAVESHPLAVRTATADDVFRPPRS
jgi:hypothetical protein